MNTTPHIAQLTIQRMGIRADEAAEDDGVRRMVSNCDRSNQWVGAAAPGITHLTSRSQRLLYLLQSFIGGFVLSLLGSIFFLISSPALFAVLYSVGVIVSLMGTGFLIGFKKQFQQMWVWNTLSCWKSDSVKRY